MSSARKHFCEFAKRLTAAGSLPSKYGINGCIPLPVKSVVGSFSGTVGEDGIIACPRSLKNSKYFSRISFMPIIEHSSMGLMVGCRHEVSPAYAEKWLANRPRSNARFADSNSNSNDGDRLAIRK